MVHSSVEMVSEQEETEDYEESEIQTNQELSITLDSAILAEQSSIQVSEQLKIEDKFVAEELWTSSEDRQIDDPEININTKKRKYNTSFQLKETENRDSEIDDKNEIKDNKQEKNLTFSSDSSNKDLTIPVSELDRRLEYFAHIWLLHRKGIEPSKMLNRDNEDILILYETNYKRVQEDFIRLKTAIQLGEVPIWHKRKFAEHIVPREVVPTYTEPTSGETIIPDQDIIQEVEYLIESFVKGLPG